MSPVGLISSVAAYPPYLIQKVRTHTHDWYSLRGTCLLFLRQCSRQDVGSGSQTDRVLHLEPRGELRTAAESKHTIRVVFKGNATSLLQGCEMSCLLHSPTPIGFFCIEGMIELLLLGSVLSIILEIKIRKASSAGL